MEELKILTKDEVLARGLEFDGEIIQYSGEYGEQVCDTSLENKELPITGILYEMHSNGNLNYYSYYVNGFPDGETVYFYEDGSLKSYESLLNSVSHGKTVCWYENGSVKSKSTSKYGITTSLLEWDENGNLVKEEYSPSEFGKRMIEKYESMEKSE